MAEDGGGGTADCCSLPRHAGPDYPSPGGEEEGEEREVSHLQTRQSVSRVRVLSSGSRLTSRLCAGWSRSGTRWTEELQYGPGPPRSRAGARSGCSPASSGTGRVWRQAGNISTTASSCRAAPSPLTRTRWGWAGPRPAGRREPVRAGQLILLSLSWPVESELSCLGRPRLHQQQQEAPRPTPQLR